MNNNNQFHEFKEKPIIYDDIEPPFISLLEQRGIVGRDATLSFLYPRLENLPPPAGMKGLESATEVIVRAVRERRKIVIWGDYDVDGTTGTSLLVIFFREIGVEVTWHIPDRITEGYGLNHAFLRTIAENLQDFHFLLLTVDCGISNADVIEEVQRWGVEVIVTDHHQIQKDLLPSCIIVNPHQENCGFAESNLAGAGVAFYLAAGIRGRLQSLGFFEKIPAPNLKNLLAFVALGSIADMVPMRSVNRILTRAGLEAMEDCSYPGISALLSSATIMAGRIFSEDIGFSLGPRINAAGRMGQSELAVKVLTCTDTKEAEQLALRLSKLNDERKKRCNVDLEKALTFVDPFQIEKERCCVLVGDFHHGTMGITASKLTERLFLPVIICSYLNFNENSGCNPILKGSCRSIEGVNIFKALEFCKKHLLSYGGHALAAGLSLEHKSLIGFKKDFLDFIRLNSGALGRNRSRLVHDIDLSISKIFSKKNIQFFLEMDPFGQGNEKPIFYDKAAVVIEARTLGANKEHLQLTFRGNGINPRGIGFGLGEKFLYVREKGECGIFYTLSCNRYRNKQVWQLMILGID